MMSRYELKQGKYGMYFYDTKHNRSLTLKYVLNKMNMLEDIRLNELNRELTDEEFDKVLLMG